jgi:hypothetical protein
MLAKQMYYAPCHLHLYSFNHYIYYMIIILVIRTLQISQHLLWLLGVTSTIYAQTDIIEYGT